MTDFHPRDSELSAISDRVCDGCGIDLGHFREQIVWVIDLKHEHEKFKVALERIINDPGVEDIWSASEVAREALGRS